MRKYFFGLIAIFIAFAFITPLISKAGDDNLYRNDDYYFRIKFPTGWEIKDGDGEHVVKKAVENGSTVLIQVRDFSSSLSEEEKNTLSDKDKQDALALEFSDFTDQELEDFSSELINGMLEAFPGSKTIEKNISYIDNRKAVYFKMNQVYKVQDLQVEGISINYFTIHKGKLFQVGGFYPKGDSYQEPIIKSSLATFVFEDWGNTENIQNQTSTNSTSKWPGDLFGGNLNGWEIFLAIIISILFTWVFGLFIPILFRFVIFKATLSKGTSVAIAGVVWIIQFIISEALGNSGKHLALVLVAYVSYKIMRSGSHKEEVSKFCKECGNQINASATICNKCHTILTSNIQAPKKR